MLSCAKAVAFGQYRTRCSGYQAESTGIVVRKADDKLLLNTKDQQVTVICLDSTENFIMGMLAAPY